MYMLVFCGMETTCAVLIQSNETMTTWVTVEWLAVLLCQNIILISMSQLMFLNRFLTTCMP
jgi:hypothetical protein